MTDNKFLRSFRSLGDMFHPPFDGLWLLAVLYFVWCYLVYPHALMLSASFPDTDDYMYLNQMLDWMNGQGWYDNIQYRLDPPAGVPIQFSRLVLLPMAIITKAIEFLGLGPKGSATIMAMIFPPMLLGLLFVTVRWVAENFMPKNWAGVTSYVGLFCVSMMYMFQPGHVDHHNLLVLLEAVTLGCAFRMIQMPESRRWPFYHGLVMAFAMVAALEVLPWLLLMSSFIGFWAVIKGGNAARSGLYYALSLLFWSAVGLLLTQPPSDLMHIDVLIYSVVYVILAAAMGLVFLGVFFAAKTHVGIRLVVGAVLAGICGFAFLHHFPELLGGPYGGIDPALAVIILNEINEAQPLKDPNAGWMDVFWLVAGSFLALPLSLWIAKRSSGVQRWQWCLLTLLFVAMTALTFFYQRRFVATMQMLSIFPLAVFLQRGYAWIGAHWRGRRQFFAELALVLVVGPIPAVLLPALNDNRPFNTGVALFPVVPQQTAQMCQMYELENALRNPMGLGKKQLLIMNSISEGPELLFRTQHKILAAPFHMNVQGNVDSTRFFSTPYPEEAEAIARRRHVDLVVTCLYAAGFYFHNKAYGNSREDGGPGQDFAPHFVERLITGHIPTWLKPVKIDGLKNYVIYQVLPPKLEMSNP